MNSSESITYTRELRDCKSYGEILKWQYEHDKKYFSGMENIGFGEWLKMKGL